MSGRRIFVDITMAARAGGRSDGINRVIRELAIHGGKRSDTALVVFDPDTESLLEIRRCWSAEIIAGSAIVDLPYYPTGPVSKKPRQGWLSHPRRRAYRALDRLRLGTGIGARLSGYLQVKLTNEKYRREFLEPNGHRRRLIPTSEASIGRVALNDEDILLLCGSDWPAMYRILKARTPGMKGYVVVLCHDIIPLLYPQFFLPTTANMFNLCFEEVFRAADLIVFTTETVRRDALAYCKAAGRAMPSSCVVPLGAMAPPGDAQASLSPPPKPLQEKKYILFVSTIEPRKGHDMLLSVWKRIVQTPWFQQSGFKMVFVGRKGWLVDELYARFASEPCVGKSLLIFSDVDDRALFSLYENAAFCVYPSIYEGFGLPVVEGFRHGKAVISSNGGALPEVVAGLSPCLDPRDEDAWFRLLSSWIENPEERLKYETAIRLHFRPRSWTEASEEFFNVMTQNLPGRRAEA
jgi:glycosyltransferase involved in cell wall biosynthesis